MIHRDHNSSESSSLRELNSSYVVVNRSFGQFVRSRSREQPLLSPAARREFMNTYLRPSTGKTSGACPGYVVDHISLLKRGGADAPYNAVADHRGGEGE